MHFSNPRHSWISSVQKEGFSRQIRSVAEPVRLAHYWLHQHYTNTTPTRHYTNTTLHQHYTNATLHQHYTNVTLRLNSHGDLLHGVFSRFRDCPITDSRVSNIERDISMSTSALSSSLKTRCFCLNTLAYLHVLLGVWHRQKYRFLSIFDSAAICVRARVRERPLTRSYNI